MTRKNRYAVMDAASSGNWNEVTVDALAALDLKSLQKLMGTIPRQYPRSDARDSALDLVRAEIKHAKNQLTGMTSRSRYP